MATIELLNANDVAGILRLANPKSAYDIDFPPSSGIVVRIGRRIRWNRAKLMDFLESGGCREL